MSSYEKVVGGKLNLKGGISLTKQELKKKKKKKKVKAPEGEHPEGEEGEEGAKQDLGGIDITAPGKGYEELFPYESKRAKESKGRTQCYGTNYRAAPEILHGYDRKVKGETVEERLDMRCGQKADKFCK
mmetsp:Transcript_189/g.494  ORF Transcript_189/g.494 Transcript_189/m.494 type:complete len:129 (-) Transcript_189:1134-1520(-)|eukprot:CAMPEP_0118925598 /NCGR_PEP_ID=MMETSP1169-20130426/3467_1 /TAXON_ID=36882 /ORGANISM="Pyramimonas obovata, Strain CCMP722" /LENGTH=128 /DNA_ID=CAMNT_0006866945 /DNA_START=144 /DNA_END=530 /DNA_ORIENTATION=-